MSQLKKENESLWGPLVIIILCIAGLLLLFSLFSPYIFTRFTDDIEYQFDETTGVIGDTFGIMNPFIGLIGVLLTFLAFYMQIEANKLQRDQFNTSRDDDKKLLVQTQKIEAFDNLDLLSVNLDSIIKDIKAKGERIQEYETALRNEPFKSHILKRTPSKDYLKILEINRGAIHRAYRFFSVSDNADYIRLYNTLDFLPEFFDDFYPRVTNFIKESFDTKMKLRNDIINFLNENASILVQLEQQLGHTYLTNPNAMLANETIKINYEIIGKNFDASGNPISETDWEEIDEKLLKKFITDTNSLKDEGNLDIKMIPVIANASNIRKEIALLKSRAIEFADQIKLQYDDLFNDEAGELSIETTLLQINEKIKKSLEIAKLGIEAFYKF